MSKINYKIMYEEFIHHWNIFGCGIARMLYGTMATLLFVVAAWGFTAISFDTWYIGVFKVIAAVCTMCIAFWNVYCMGRKRGGKK